jgi:hypothetical protein
MTQQSTLELGVRPSKRASTDPLLEIMRRIIAEHAGVSRSDAVQLFRERVSGDGDFNELVDACIGYAAEALWDRCTPRPRYQPSEDERREVERVRGLAKDIIEAKIVLWTMKLPTNGKPLCDCSFGEIDAAAPLNNRFLSRLAVQGASGSLVREVFKDKQALQEFWAACQT